MAGFIPSILKGQFKFGSIFSGAKSKNSVQIQRYYLGNNDKIEDLRKNQWEVYKQNFFNLHLGLNTAALGSRQDDSSKIIKVKFSDLGKAFKVEDIQSLMLVPENTHLAEMSCVDEATQLGEFINETNLNGEPLGTLSDPNAARYVIDFPGSGALTYECLATDQEKLSKEEITKIEDQRLSVMAERVVNWCKTRNIIKFTVTYHCGCGAVNRRLKRNPEICSDGELETAKQCATTTAKKISLKAKEIGYNLEVTTAYIGDAQMCKLRPMNMHNALGTIGALDSRVLASKFDSITGTTFFDVFIYSDFKFKDEKHEIVEDIIDQAVRSIGLTYQIATGGHGWGPDHFSTPDTKYPVILFSNGDNQEVEAQEVFNKLQEFMEPEEVAKMSFFSVRTDL
ncbi:MAG: hypothetical protein WCK98_01805 [bacterium]